MKIAIHVDGSTIRGNERQVIRLATGLAARRHEIVVSCRHDGPVEAELRRHGVRTVAVRPRGDADLWSALRFAAWLRRERLDALLLTSWKRAFIGLAAARLARVPTVALRIGGLHPVGSGLRDLDERHALRAWADAIVVNARAIERLLIESVPRLEPRRIHYVPNGIEPIRADPLPLRRQLGLRDDHVLVASVGGIEPRKGFPLLVEAISRLPAEVHGVLIGGGQAAHSAELERLSAAARVQGRIHLLGHRDDVGALLAACDLFALPSLSEGMPLVMLEAMSVRVPVVAFDVGGVADALEASRGRPAAGWIVPAGDVDALTAALAALIARRRSDPAAVEARVAEAAWRIENWFSIPRMLDRYEIILAGSPVRPDAASHPGSAA